MEHLAGDVAALPWQQVLGVNEYAEISTNNIIEPPFHSSGQARRKAWIENLSMCESQIDVKASVHNACNP